MTQNSLDIPLILNISHCITEGVTKTFFFVKADFCLPGDIPIWYGTICFALVVCYLPFLYLFISVAKLRLC